MKELDVVRLKSEFSELPAGTTGTILFWNMTENALRLNSLTKTEIPLMLLQHQLSY